MYTARQARENLEHFDYFSLQGSKCFSCPSKKSSFSLICITKQAMCVDTYSTGQHSSVEGSFCEVMSSARNYISFKQSEEPCELAW